MLVALATSRHLAAQLPPDERALSSSLAELGVLAHVETWSSSDTDWSQFDAVVVRSCWDYHLRVGEFRQWLDRLQQAGVQLINSPNLIRWNIDKRYLREIATRGVPIPDTIWLADGEQIDINDTCRSRSWPTAIVKPLISASAYGLERIREGIAQGPAMVQEYLPEIESAGEWSLVYFDGKFSHGVIKRAAMGGFRVQSDFGGTSELATPSASLIETAEKAIALLPGKPLFARVDMVERGSAALLMELELIEPELFVALDAQASRRMARVIRDAVLR